MSDSPGRAVVIGAGITGTLSALALIDQGWTVTLVEAKEPGAGSSSRSAACIRQQFSTESTVRAQRFAVHYYEHFASELALDHWGQVLEQNGYLFLHENDQRFELARTHVAIQQAAGLTEVVALDSGQVGERFPWVAAERVRGATFCPTDGFLRPDKVYLGAVESLRAKGGEVLLQAPVTAGHKDGNRLVAVETDRGTVEGELFVNATNAWAARLSEILGGVELPISALKRYLYFLRRGGKTSSDELAGLPMTIVPSRAYCHPENGEQLMMGWAHHAHHDNAFGHDSQDFIEPAFHHKSGLDNYGTRLWIELAGWMPGVAEYRGLDATTAGYYASTPDHNPFIALDPEVPNLLHAAGFSGHGAMMGPFSARAVACLAENSKARTVLLPTGEVSLESFAIGRNFDDAEAMVI